MHATMGNRCTLLPTALFIGLISSSAIHADLAAPPDRGQPKVALPAGAVPFEIIQDRNARGNRLVIPQQFLRDAKSAGWWNSPGEKIRTVIAGSAIALAIAGGVFLVLRKRSRVTRLAASFLLIGTLALGGSQLLQADVAPPIYDVVSSWRHVSDGKKAVVIEVTEKGDTVQLIVGTYRKRVRPGGDPRRDVPKSAPQNDGAAAPDREKASSPAASKR